MYYYGYQNYAAGVIGILVLAVALTALLVVLVLPKEKDGHLPSVFQMLYDLFSPKTLVMEKLLQILYVFLTCLAVLYGIVVFQRVLLRVSEPGPGPGDPGGGAHPAAGGV